jgi:hypothetical protein
MDCYGEGLYVDYVRTSQETNQWTVTEKASHLICRWFSYLTGDILMDCYGDNFIVLWTSCLIIIFLYNHSPEQRALRHSLRTSLNDTDQVSHPYRTKGKIVVLCIEIHINTADEFQTHVRKVPGSDLGRDPKYTEFLALRLIRLQ